MSHVPIQRLDQESTNLMTELPLLYEMVSNTALIWSGVSTSITMARLETVASATQCSYSGLLIADEIRNAKWCLPRSNTPCKSPVKNICNECSFKQ